MTFGDFFLVKNLSKTDFQKNTAKEDFSSLITIFFTYKNIQLCLRGEDFLKRVSNELSNDYTNNCRRYLIINVQKKSILAFQREFHVKNCCKIFFVSISTFLLTCVLNDLLVARIVSFSSC